MASELPILIAEDNSDDAELLKKAFQRNNITTPIFFVRDGNEAIQYLEGQEPFADRAKFPFPKVIISDLKMPRLSGLELLQWLRDHPECSILPLILMSASGLEQDIKNAYKFGANAYFEKPGSFDELVRVIKVAHEFWITAKTPDLHKC